MERTWPFCWLQTGSACANIPVACAWLQGRINELAPGPGAPASQGPPGVLGAARPRQASRLWASGVGNVYLLPSSRARVRGTGLPAGGSGFPGPFAARRPCSHSHSLLSVGDLLGQDGAAPSHPTQAGRGADGQLGAALMPQSPPLTPRKLAAAHPTLLGDCSPSYATPTGQRGRGTFRSAALTLLGSPWTR